MPWRAFGSAAAVAETLPLWSCLQLSKDYLLVQETSSNSSAPLTSVNYLPQKQNSCRLKSCLCVLSRALPKLGLQAYLMCLGETWANVHQRNYKTPYRRGATMGISADFLRQLKKERGKGVRSQGHNKGPPKAVKDPVDASLGQSKRMPESEA